MGFDTTLIALSKIQGIGLRTINQLPDQDILKLQNVEDIYNYINSFEGFGSRVNKSYDEIKKAYNIAQVIKEESKKGEIEIITKYDTDKYPKRFKKLLNYPPFFYAKGNTAILKKPGSAIIGTRHPSYKGMAWGTKLSEVISNKGYTVISGLATGCNSCAHIGCLKSGGETVAIMPTHLNKVYPSENKKLFHDILENKGCVISEYELGHVTNKNDFVLRDRLQAALAIGTIVIETGETGGSMHAVNTTLGLKRPLAFLKFGEEHYAAYEHARGNKLFLENNKAMPIANSSDIEKFIDECLNTDNESITKIVQPKPVMVEQSLF